MTVKPYFSVDPNTPGLQDKFWPKVDKSRPGGCWEWRGSITYKGYGQFSVGRRSMPAHRFAFLTANVLEDHTLVIDHICRNRRCVNPSHLRAVTAAENSLRGFGCAAVNAVKTHCKHGHLLSGENLIVRRQGWRACRQCLIAGYRKYRKARAALSGPETEAKRIPRFLTGSET